MHEPPKCPHNLFVLVFILFFYRSDVATFSEQKCGNEIMWSLRTLLSSIAFASGS